MVVAVNSVAAVKAANTTDLAVLLDVAGSEGMFFWTSGDFTGQADDLDIIQSTGTAISSGAWVRQQAESIRTRRGGADTLARRLANRLNAEPASVLDYIPPAEHADLLAGTSSYDCTDAFQRCSDENLRWHIPRGIYLISDEGVALRAGSHVSGDGHRTTLVRKTNDQVAQLFRAIGADNVTLEDMFLQGSRSQSATYDLYKFCLFFTDCENVTIRRLIAVEATTDNIMLELCRNVVLRDVESHDCNKDGIYLSSCDGVEMSNIRTLRNGPSPSGVNAGQGGGVAIACTWSVMITNLYSCGNRGFELGWGRGSRDLKFMSCVLGDEVTGRSTHYSVNGQPEQMNGSVHGQVYDSATSGAYYGGEEVRFYDCDIAGRISIGLTDDLQFYGGNISGDVALGSTVNLLGCTNVAIRGSTIRDFNLVGVALFDHSETSTHNDGVLIDGVAFLNAGSSTRVYDYSSAATNVIERNSSFNNAEVDVTMSRAPKANPDFATAIAVQGSTVVGARKTGWTSPTGTAERGSYATYAAPTGGTPVDTAALASAVQALSRRHLALESDLRAHGLIN